MIACGFRVKGVKFRTPKFGFLVTVFRVTIESFFALKLQDVAINRGAFLVAFRVKNGRHRLYSSIVRGKEAGGWGILNPKP